MRAGPCLFIGLFTIALFVTGAVKAQVVDGDLSYWRYDETPEVVDTIGLGQFSGRQIVALCTAYASVFDGDGWTVLGAGDEYMANMAQGPDGKVWFRTCPGSSTGYWEKEGWSRSGQFCGGVTQDGWLLDILAWRGISYFVFGRNLNQGADVFRYCDPGCEDMSHVLSLHGPSGQYGEHYLYGCTVSGDYLAMISTGLPRVIHIPDGDMRDLPDCRWGTYTDTLGGCDGYFWIERSEEGIGLMRLDAVEGHADYVEWLRGSGIDSLAMDWRGLWVLGRDSLASFFVALWSFRAAGPDVIRWIKPEAGTHGYGIVGMHQLLRKRMTVTSVGELWFATDKAVVRWTPDPDMIPMPFEARVEAKRTGLVYVTIEFHNPRIIRNDASLWLKIEFLDADGQVLPGSLVFNMYYDFQPSQTRS